MSSLELYRVVVLHVYLLLVFLVGFKIFLNFNDHLVCYSIKTANHIQTIRRTDFVFANLQTKIRVVK